VLAARAALNGVSTSRVWLTAFVVVALVIRLGFFLSSPHPYENSGLASDHGEVARNIVSHGKWFVLNQKALTEIGVLQQHEHKLVDLDQVDFSKADARPDYEPEALQTPGLALVLAAFWWVTGDQDYSYVQALQILLDTAMVLLVYWASLSLFGRHRAALVAAGLYAVFLPLAALANIPHLDTWATYFTIAIFCLFLKARASMPRWPWLVALGVATGSAVYFRPFLSALPVALAIALAVGEGWRKAWALAVVPVVIALGFMTPWTVRNYDEFHRFIPMRIGIGQNLWEGLGEEPNHFGAVLDDQVTARQVSRERPDLVYGTPAYDEYLFEKGRRAIEHHPGFYAKLLARRTILSTILLHNRNWVGQSASPVESLAARVAEPLLFLLALLTVVATWRKRWRQHVLLLVVPLAVIAPYVLLHVETRYALPGSFVYLILLGLGVDQLLAWRAERHRPVENASASTH
jgi:4-amino-4-deoxy-L-arabinose transferase-like glycosyltransferase